MTIKNANLDGILAELTRRKAEKQAGDQGDQDTTHPIKDAPNSTEDGSTGASASEATSDVKDQQSIGVENTGGPSTEANPSGSMGVEDKKPDEGADLDNGDTSGVSEMANKDTTHPIAKAAKALELLDAAIKEAEEAEEGTGEKLSEEQEAEKLAAYANELETDHAEAVADGEKFAEHVLSILQERGKNTKTAEQKLINMGAIKQLIKLSATKEDAEKIGSEDNLNKLAMELAGQGVDPAELEAALAAEAGGMDPAMGGGMDPAMGGGMDPAMGGGDPAMEGGGEVELAQLAAALEEAGITPEILEAALAQGQLGEGEQDAALDAAMGETGVTPEEIAASGGELPMEVVGSADRVKIASEKQAAFLALKNRLCVELKQLKEGATK